MKPRKGWDTAWRPGVSTKGTPIDEASGLQAWLPGSIAPPSYPPTPGALAVYEAQVREQERVAEVHCRLEEQIKRWGVARGHLIETRDEFGVYLQFNPAPQRQPYYYVETVRWWVSWQRSILERSGLETMWNVMEDQ